MAWLNAAIVNSPGRWRCTVLCAVGLLLAACTVRQGATSTGGTKPPESVLNTVGRVSEPGMPCSQAIAIAGRALVKLGYTVETVEPAGPNVPGRVVGQRETGWTPRIPEPDTVRSIVITVSCSDSGSEFEASTDESFFRRRELRQGFSRAINAMAEGRIEQPRIGSQLQPGLVIAVEPQRNRGAAAEFGADLPASGVTPVHLKIENRTERTYGFQRANVKLVTQEGKSVEPLPLEAVTDRLGSGLRAKLEMKLIGEGDVAPGAMLAGFVYVPVSAYRRATILLMDRATGEAEGLAVEF